MATILANESGVLPTQRPAESPSPADFSAGIPQDAGNPLDMIEEAKRTERERKKKMREKVIGTLNDFEKFHPDEPEGARKMALVDAFVQTELGHDPGRGLARDRMRALTAARFFEGRGAESDDEFFEQIKGFAGKQKARREVANDLTEKAFRSRLITLAGGVSAGAGPLEGSYEEWKQEMAGHEGYDERDEWQYRLAWQEAKENLEEVMEPFEPILKEVFEGIRGTKNDRLDRSWFADELETLNEDQRENFKMVLAMLLKEEARPRTRGVLGDSEELGNLAEQSRRDLTRIVRDLWNNLKEVQHVAEHFDADLVNEEERATPGNYWEAASQNMKRVDWTPEKEARAQEARESIAKRRRLTQFVKDVEELAQGKFDPVIPVRDKEGIIQNFEKGMYMAPGFAATTLAAVVPYVGPLASYTLVREEGRRKLRGNLLEAGLSDADATEAAYDMAGPAAIPATLMERLGARGIIGKMPALDKVLTKMSDTMLKRAAARYTARSVGGATFETATELAQDMTFELAQDVSAALDEDIPDVKWTGEDGVLSHLKSDETMQMWFGMLPLAIAGAHRGMRVDQRNKVFSEASELELKALGMSGENAKAIREAKGPDSLNKAVEKGLGSLDPRSEETMSAADELAKQYEAKLMAAEEAMDSGVLPRLVENNGEWTVYDGMSGEEITRTNSRAEALKVASEKTKSFDLESDARLEQARAEYLETVTEAMESESGEGLEQDFRPGETVTQEQAAAMGENAEARIGWQTRNRETVETGDARATGVVLGWSGQETAEGVRRDVNRLNAGASALTVVHEKAHANFRRALETGALDRQRSLDMVRAVQRVLQNRDSGRNRKLAFDYLPENDAEVTNERLDEAIAEIVEAEVLRTRKDGARGNLPAGVITRNLKAIGKILGGVDGKFVSFIRAMKEHFGLVFGRAAAVNRALKKGEIDKAEYDAFLTQAMGIDEQVDYDQLAREAEAAAIDGGVEFQPTDDMPFSVGQSITSQQDAAYMQAVEAGDMETAQQMVDEAAKAAGYDAAKAMHGTGEKFDRFSHEHRGKVTEAESAKRAFFFTDGPASALSYAQKAATFLEDQEVSTLLKKAERAEKVGDWDAYEKAILEAEQLEFGGDAQERRARIEEENAVVLNVFLRGRYMTLDAEGKNYRELDEAKDFELFDGSLSAALDEARENGFDGLRVNNFDDAINYMEAATHWAVFEPSDIKSGDPVTYDESGSVIPLSERFNPNDDRISFSVGETAIKGYFEDQHEGQKLRQAVEETQDLFAWGQRAARASLNRDAVTRPGDLQREASQTDEARNFGKLISNISGLFPDKAAKEIDRILQEGDGAPISNIIASMLSRELPVWNPVGSIARTKEDIFALNAALRNPWFESFRVMAVDSQNRVIAAEVQTIGSIDQVQVDKKRMHAFILRAQAVDPNAALIVSHNHPSVNPEPSRADLSITNQVKRISETLGFELRDHIITNGTDGYSISENSHFEMPTEMEVEWAAVPRQFMEQLTSPQKMQRIAGAMRAANKDAVYVAYLDSQMRMRAMNLLPRNDVQAAARMIARDAGDSGSKHLVILGPREFVRENFIELGELAKDLDLKLIDIISGTDSDLESYREMGLLSEPELAENPSFSIGTATLPEALRGDVIGRMTSPARRVAVLDKMLRNLEKLHLAHERMKLEHESPRASKSLRKEAAMREAQRREELENEAMLRWGHVLEIEDQANLTAQPIHGEVMKEATDKNGRRIWKGRMMSQTAMRKKYPERYKDKKIAEYDGSEGISRTVFGGTIAPDEMAQELYEAKLISAPDVDVMWDALRSEQAHVKQLKEQLEAARTDLREVRAEAKHETNEWLKQRLKSEETEVRPDHLKRASLEALATLEGILGPLPAEIRGKIGGHLQIARLSTAEARIGELKKRLDRADKELKKYISQQYNREMKELFARAKPEQSKPGEKPKGKLAASTHQIFAKMEEYFTLSEAEVESEAERLEKLAENEDAELTDEDRAVMELTANMIRLAGAWHAADLARKEMALQAGLRLFDEGLAQHMAWVLAKREHYRSMRSGAIDETGSTGEAVARDERETRDEQTLKGKAEGLGWALYSFDQMLKLSFGHDSRMAARYSDWETRAAYGKQDNLQRTFMGLDELFEQLAGSNLEGQKMRHALGSEKLEVSAPGPRGKIKRSLTQFEMIQATLMWQQEDGRRHMIGHLDDAGNPIGNWHYNQDFMDAIEEKLSPEARAVRVHLREHYGQEYERLNKVYRRLYNVDLPRHELYAPLTVQGVQQGERELADPVTGFGMGAGSLSPGSLKSRNNMAVAEPRFADAVQTFIGHSMQMEHWMAYAPMVTEMMAVMRNRDVRNAVEEKVGKEGLRILNLWVDHFAHEGNQDAAVQLGLNRLANRVMSRLSLAALAGRVSVLAMQSVQSFAALAEMPTGAFAKRFAMLTTGQLDFRAALNSDYIKRRMHTMPPAVRLALEGLKAGKPSRVKFAAHKLGLLMNGADAFFTSATYAITYDYHLSQAKNQGLSGAEAEAYATDNAVRATDRVAQPLRPGRRSLVEATATHPAMRMLTAFASEPRNKLMLASYQIHAKRSAGEKARAIAVSWIANGLLVGIIRSWMRDLRSDDDDELFDERNWNPTVLGVQSILGPLTAIPYFGDELESALMRATGNRAFEGTLMSVGGDIGGMINNADDYFTGDVDMDRVMRDVELLLNGAAFASENAAGGKAIMNAIRDTWRMTNNFVD